jgi:hypothetical protein
VAWLYSHAIFLSIKKEITMQTVYDSKTGEAITLNKVDARERLVAGLATSTPKPVEQQQPPVETKKQKYRAEQPVIDGVKDDE